MNGFPGYLPAWRLRLARTGAILAIVGGVVYLQWRVTQLAELGPAAWIFFAAELINYLVLVIGVPLMWRPRPRRWAPPAKGTLDVYIPVCGEPVEMVERTVRAALAIDYPHETYVLNDGRLAGIEGWDEIDALCERLGVTCFTRTGGPRGKAGNLNHALPRTTGEFIAAIDADHVADPDLADDLLGHFHPRVAFVTTRQAFDIEDSDLLGHQEQLFYSVIQPAKDGDNAAFSTGNGVVYRRAAIVDNGGWSQWNLVEDLRTSYELHARGWQSIYVPRAVTRGTAPGTAAEMAAQRLRWATDSLRLFFYDNPLKKKGLTWRQRLHYAQTTGWYLAAAAHCVFLLSPILSILVGLKVLVPGAEVAYVGHLAIYLIPVAIFLISFAGWRGTVRMFQMQAFLAPVYGLAAWRAIRMPPGHATKRVRKLSGGVTQKAKQRQVNMITFVQHVVLALLLVSIGIALAREGGPEWGIVMWACILAIALASTGSMISLRFETAQSVRIALTAPVVAAVVLVALSAWAPVPGSSVATPVKVVTQVPGGGGGGNLQAAFTGPTKLDPPGRGAYLGVYNPKLAGPPSAPVDLGRYDGTNMRLIHRFQAWWGEDRFLGSDWLKKVNRAGAVPLITWEPWRKPDGSVVDGDQRPGLLRDIADGKWDSFVRLWARDAALYGRPIVLRFMHEMNGAWYPWTAIGNGNDGDDYKAAWRHVYRIFEREGAKNVSWVWSIDSSAGGEPTPLSELESYYPGDRYVDWVGLSGFNWGVRSDYGGWLDFDDVFSRVYPVIRSFGKPIMLSEVGTAENGGDPAAWVRDAVDRLPDYPDIKAMVWFDSETPTADFRLKSAALRTLRRLGDTPDLRPKLRVSAAR